MKTLKLITILTLLYSPLTAQEWNIDSLVELLSNNALFDSVWYQVSGAELVDNFTITLDTKPEKYKICAEELGHVNLNGWYNYTDIYCSAYIEDQPDYTIKKSGGCNYKSYRCGRCHYIIEELEPQRIDTIWRRPSRNNIKEPAQITPLWKSN